MKKIALSMLTALAMSTATATYAAGEETASPFYVGIAYSYFDSSYGSTDVTGDGLSYLAGYDFNNYFAIEGRYTGSTGDLSIDGDDRSKSISNLALYAKATYPFNNFAIYGLLGYGQTKANNESDGAPQYGAGLSYDFNQNFGLLLDWTRLYDDKGLNYAGDTSKYKIDTWNFGVTYNF
jgi:OOP family OmpA-OmpF porin